MRVMSGVGRMSAGTPMHQLMIIGSSVVLPLPAGVAGTGRGDDSV